MLKHLLIFVFSLCLAPTLISCTSGDKEGETSNADVEMTEAVDGEAAEADPFDSEFSEVGGGEEVADLGAGDLPPEAAADGADPFADLEEGGAPAEDEFALDEGGSGDLAMDEGGTDPMAEAPPLEESMAADGEAGEAPVTDLSAPPEPQDTFAAEEPAEAPQETFPSESSGESESFQETPERSFVPLKKIADQPFTKSGILANAVYIARPGDTIERVSQKIYGMNRAEDLYKVNPSYRSSTLDVGEKVYYNSPVRPEDNTAMKTFFEDMGLAPETYIAQDGDNIRTVAKNLLGDTNSWKEIWSTNPGVESKDTLSAGTQLMYWASSEVSAPPQVSNTPTPPADTSSSPEMADAGLPPPPADDLANSIPPPPMPQNMANNEPPPPPPPGGDMGSLDEPPPPPPPPAMGSVEPPPPSAMASKRAKAPMNEVGFGAAAQQEEVMMIAIGAGLVLTALILFIIIRKKKARRHIDFNTATQTQIE